MNKIYFLFFLSILLAYVGKGLSQAYERTDKNSISVSSEREMNDEIVYELINAGDDCSDLMAVPKENVLGIVNESDIVKLTLSVNGETPKDITDLLRGGRSPYLDAVKYSLGTQLSYIIQYSWPYSPVTTSGCGASDVKVSRRGPVTYSVTFTIKGDGMVSVRATNGENKGVILGIRFLLSK